MNVQIIDRGRGPEIKGTRITVYTIWDYAREGHHHTFIAALLGLSSAQVQAALEYIEQHKDEVLADYQKILDRAANPPPYSPEVQAKVDAIKAKYDALWADRRKKAMENGDARDHGG
ncbi:MAG: DUF433 domain-containing protein [Planctomycetes bacterium]|nr:DUF433 domain-containing protein [Planctomycetota bacterium]